MNFSTLLQNSDSFSGSILNTFADKNELKVEDINALIVEVNWINKMIKNEKMAAIIWLSVTAEAKRPNATNKAVKKK